jgi:ABC-2 type transport system ATP-binding protein
VLEHVVLADDPQVGLLHAGEGRVRAVLADADVAEVRALLQAVPGLRDLAVDGDDGGTGATVTATVDGAIDPLVKSLARCTVTGLVVAEPDLEAAVLSLYAPAAASVPLLPAEQRTPTDRPLTTTGADRAR